MKTFTYSVTYHYEDAGEIQAESYSDAVAQIEESNYVVCDAGYSVPWGSVRLRLAFDTPSGYPTSPLTADLCTYPNILAPAFGKYTLSAEHGNQSFPEHRSVGLG